MTWPSGLPLVCRIAGVPLESTPANACFAAQARTASTATWTLPSVRFLNLALGRARADRAPRDGVGDVLRRDRIQELAADREAGRQHLEQELPRGREARVDVEGAVEVGIVDHALPPRRRARLLEIDAHGDEQVVLQPRGRRAQAAGVVQRGVGIMDAARADDDEQPIVGAVEDVGRRDPVADHGVRGVVGERQALEHVGGRRQRGDALDTGVAYAVSSVQLGHDHLGGHGLASIITAGPFANAGNGGTCWRSAKGKRGVVSRAPT